VTRLRPPGRVPDIGHQRTSEATTLDRTQPDSAVGQPVDLSGASGQPATEGGRGASLGDVISRSVRSRVPGVDDYIRQGQKPRSGWRPLLRTGHPWERRSGTRRTDDEVHVGLPGLWLQLMELAMGAERESRGAPHPARATPSQETPAARAAPSTDGRTEAPDETPVRIKVVSLWPTEVALDLRPEPPGRPW